MKAGVKVISSGGFVYIRLKKHVCPSCGARVRPGYTVRTVNSSSPEAKDYDFSCGDGFLVGDVEFRTECFLCPACGRTVSVGEMKAFERSGRA